MRISDLSSDVCSSDLTQPGVDMASRLGHRHQAALAGEGIKALDGNGPGRVAVHGKPAPQLLPVDADPSAVRLCDARMLADRAAHRVPVNGTPCEEDSISAPRRFREGRMLGRWEPEQFSGPARRHELLIVREDRKSVV